MKRLGWMAAAGLSALALAGCQKKTTTTAETTTAQAIGPGAAAPAAPAAPAAAPRRKAGLWQMSMSSEGVRQASTICVDADTDAKLGLAGQKPGANPCHENKITPRPGGGYDMESVCDLGDAGKMTTHGTLTGDLNGSYKVAMETTTTGSAAPQMNGTRKIEMDAVWKGPCPAGMKPGDMQVAGMKMNLLEAQKRSRGGE
ncbi:DUF3617 family protein [Phenylobacterium sp.]|uniref:DUF3617 domain-containing protein n=1 Tax=Phenylobacterium sp. TaxID=1871053 RepID=UPI0026198C1D|nr:DUF3617 family protein [Phenylobacterium sp.]